MTPTSACAVRASHVSALRRPHPIPLVATKLEPPPLPPTYTGRERLNALLSAGAAESCQLTLISAPPGYGKTMAVRGWLAQRGQPFAWLDLDEGDDDPVRLVRYLIAALGRARPGLGTQTAALLGMSGLPPLDIVVATLLNEVAVSDEPFVLVLDDYHLLASETGQTLVGRLIAQAPPFLQIAQVTREDPRLPLARWRANGRLVEVRAEELRYTVSEAAELLSALRVDLEPTSVSRLVELTEGWAAGLQLAALTMRGVADPDARVAAFGAGHRYVVDYLGDEVIARLSDELRTFLERTAVPDRICAGLANALTGKADAEQLLREIEERNLFLLPLGTDGSWYRYHHLFADYLRMRVGGELRRQLLLQAADWCSNEGLTVEATRYALASECWPAAVRIVEGGARTALAHGEPDAVMRWSAAVPPSVLNESSDLLSDLAWAAFLAGRMAEAEFAADRLSALDEEGRLEGLPAGRARGIRAWLARLHRRPEEGERLARLALASLENDPFFRGLTYLALSDASWDLGKVEESAAAVREALRLACEGPPTIATYFAGYIYAVTFNEQGHRPEAERTLRHLLAGSVDATGRTPPATGPLRVGLGMLAYEANDLATAAAELEAGFAMAHSLGIDRVLGGESRRARVMTRLATAGPEAAARVAETAIADGRRSLPATRLPYAEAVAALVALRTGDPRAALGWAQRVLDDPERETNPTPKVRLHRDLLLANILLATGRTTRGEAIATKAGRLAVWTGSVLGQVEAWILRACAAEQQGRRAEARSRMSEAIELAAPGWYVRRFVETARPVAHLLPSVRTVAEDFTDAVLAGLAEEAIRVAPGRSAPGPAWRAEDGALLELLTGRELDVLRLLARGRSNAGIGDDLGVSAGTAKWHVANVLGKLGVSTRTQAATRARDLGLV